MVIFCKRLLAKKRKVLEFFAIFYELFPNGYITVDFFLFKWYNKNAMKNKNEQIQRFHIKFSAVIVLLCIAVFLLCFVGIGVSVWRINRFGIQGFNDVIKYPFLIAVCAFCIVLMIGILVKSEYVVQGEFFVSRFGFIKSKLSIKEITGIIFDRDVNKLSLYFGEQYIVITVSPNWNENLVRALLNVNPDIDYSFTLTENKPQEQEKNEKDK